ncbi:MAG TPA: hypothetical protein VKT83_17980 [bacterium]|nr:hypothetical protein [bacterium]
MMHFVFADDSRQQTPSRPGMDYPLVAVGGVFIPSDAVRNAERSLEDLCGAVGFPPREQFKWSPGRELWMHAGLGGDARRDFFIRALRLLQDNGTRVVVVIEDTGRATATGCAAHQLDATKLFLERVHNYLSFTGSADWDGVVIADRPSGGRSDEDKFLLQCLETLHDGTEYVKPERIAVNVLSTPARLVRLVQAADLVTSCTLALVGGEDSFSPPIFEAIRPMLLNSGAATGGVGLKIHPDLRYANLYRWLLGDEYIWRGGWGTPLPQERLPYATGPNRP